MCSAQYYVIYHKLDENIINLLNVYLQLIYKQKNYSNVFIK